MGHFSRAMLSAGGALLGYLEATQVGNMPRLLPLSAVSDAGFMEIDPATRRSLELSRTLTGERRGSLLHAVDRTLTAAGGRLLGERLAAPLFDVAAIESRLDLVSWFLAETACGDKVRSQLRIQPDIERALSRLSLGHGGPRDLANIANGLDGAGEIAAQIKAVAAKGMGGLALPDGLPDCLDMMLCPRGLSDELTPALADELPLLGRDGGFIRQGYDLALDDLRGLRDESRRLIVALQSRYVDETGIASLKIKHNNVLGYHIDVRSNHAGKLMDHEIFIHRQTTAQAVRFTTTELAQMERDIQARNLRQKFSLLLFPATFDYFQRWILRLQLRHKLVADGIVNVGHRVRCHNGIHLKNTLTITTYNLLRCLTHLNIRNGCQRHQPTIVGPDVKLTKGVQ